MLGSWLEDVEFRLFGPFASPNKVTVTDCIGAGMEQKPIHAPSVVQLVLELHPTDFAVGLPNSYLTFVSESEEGIHPDFHARNSAVWLHPLNDNLVVPFQAEPRVQLCLLGVSNRTFFQIRHYAIYPLGQGSHKSGPSKNEESEAQKI
jgi:hypothetical protein